MIHTIIYHLGVWCVRAAAFVQETHWLNGLAMVAQTNIQFLTVSLKCNTRRQLGAEICKWSTKWWGKMQFSTYFLFLFFAERWRRFVCMLPTARRALRKFYMASDICLVVNLSPVCCLLVCIGWLARGRTVA